MTSWNGVEESVLLRGQNNRVFEGALRSSHHSHRTTVLTMTGRTLLLFVAIALIALSAEVCAIMNRRKKCQEGTSKSRKNQWTAVMRNLAMAFFAGELFSSHFDGMSCCAVAMSAKVCLTMYLVLLLTGVCPPALLCSASVAFSGGVPPKRQEGKD